MSSGTRLDLVLDEAQTIELTRILVDEDADSALQWLRDVAEAGGRHAQAKLDVVLRGEAVLTFSRIIRENAAEDALHFLYAHLEDELKKSRNPHCVPVFEVCYRPNQADSYATDAESD